MRQYSKMSRAKCVLLKKELNTLYDSITLVTMSTIQESTEIHNDTSQTFGDVDYNKLKNVRDIIESLGEVQQREVLQLIMKDPSLIISENKSGTFINMSDLSSSVFNDIYQYIEHVKAQEAQLMTVEKTREEYEANYFSK